MRMRWMVLTGAAVLAAACSSTGKLEVKAKEDVKLGTAAARRGYWQEANFRFAAAREKRPDDPEILNDLAVSLEALGRYDEALATYKAALALAPSSRLIRRNYARFAEFYTSFARGVKPKGVGDASS